MVGLPPDIMERALILCRNGQTKSWSSLRRRLSREGYDPDHPKLIQHQNRIDDAMARAAASRGTLGLDLKVWARTLRRALNLDRLTKADEG